MATQVQPSKEEVTRERKVAVTSVRILPETKEALDRLLAIRGVETFDDLIYDLVREQMEPDLGMALPPRVTTPRELAARLAQVEEALRRIELDLLVTDPKTGVVYNPVRARGGVIRKLKGALPLKGEPTGFFDSPRRSEAGVHVTMHDETEEDGWASERDGELSPALIEHVKMEHQKQEKREPISPRGRFFREPAPAASAPEKTEGKKAPAPK